MSNRSEWASNSVSTKPFYQRANWSVASLKALKEHQSGTLIAGFSRPGLSLPFPSVVSFDDLREKKVRCRLGPSSRTSGANSCGDNG